MQLGSLHPLIAPMAASHQGPACPQGLQTASTEHRTVKGNPAAGYWRC